MDELVARLHNFGVYGAFPPPELWDDCVTAATAIETLTAERDAALARVAVLEPYLRHNGLCGIVGGYGRCTCGLDAARKALEASHDA